MNSSSHASRTRAVACMPTYFSGGHAPHASAHAPRMKPGLRSHSPLFAQPSQFVTSARLEHGGIRGSSTSQGDDFAGNRSFQWTVMSVGLSPALNRRKAVVPSERSFIQICTSLSFDSHQIGVPPALRATPCETRRACLAPGSWLIARSSGDESSLRSRLRMVLGSLPSMRGAESMHQKAKCVRCSVNVRPPTVPQSSRETYWPRTQAPLGKWFGQSSTMPYGVIPSRPTSSISGSL
mmetsp:Transcript_17/g.87  ORF Transcript_17/g.87 Transcript_17/m.87 type:complete len:237 (+) Transcript_17:628-1338(+)